MYKCRHSTAPRPALLCFLHILATSCSCSQLCVYIFQLFFQQKFLGKHKMKVKSCWQIITCLKLCKQIGRVFIFIVKWREFEVSF